MEYILLADPRASDIKQQTGSHVINNVYLILHLNNTLLAMSHKGNGVENTFSVLSSHHVYNHLDNMISIRPKTHAVLLDQAGIYMHITNCKQLEPKSMIR